MGTTNLRRWASGVSASGGASSVVIKTVDPANLEGIESVIYVTLIRFSIMGHANAKITFFEDSAPSAVQIAQFDDLTVAAGTPGTNGTVEWNFGRRGARLTVNRNFVVRSQAAGTSGLVYAEGYQRLNN